MTWLQTRVGKGIVVVGLVLAACGDDKKGSADTLDGGSTPVATMDAGAAPFDGAIISHSPDGAVMQTPSDGSVRDGGETTRWDGGPDAAHPLPCGGSNCSDGVDCTSDLCVNDKCVHTVDARACQAGFSCDFAMGCHQGVACKNDTDCPADTNLCTSHERCEPVQKRCVFDAFDADGDGYPPASCGGVDCDDDNGLVNPSAKEACNGVDDNCNGMIDELATVAPGQVCISGHAACQQGFSSCGALLGCADLQNDEQNCGSCGNDCGTGGGCLDGSCIVSCTDPYMGCGQECVDTLRSDLNCGACGNVCHGVPCNIGVCRTCGGDGELCCDSPVPLVLPTCSGLLSCVGGSGGPHCVCAAPLAHCGADCVDLDSDEAHCGACGTACPNGEACVTDSRGTACTSCGGLGEPCCALDHCDGNKTCGPTGTCVTGLRG